MKGKSDSIDLIGPELVKRWIGSVEAHKIKRRALLFPFFSVLAVMVCASILLAAVLWHIPSSTDIVAKLFAVEMFRENFPTVARLHSYLAKKHGEPWDVFLPSILAINIVASLIAAVFFSFWILFSPLTAIKDADRKNLQLISRSRATAGRAIFFLLLFVAIGVFVVSVGLLGGNPSRDFGQARKSIALGVALQHLLIMFLPPSLAMTAFFLKFRRMLERLRARTAPAA